MSGSFKRGGISITGDQPKKCLTGAQDEALSIKTYHQKKRKKKVQGERVKVCLDDTVCVLKLRRGAKITRLV